MAHRNWEVMKVVEKDVTLSVKLNTDIADALFERKLVVKMKDDYPWVVEPSTSCSTCAPSSCAHAKPEKFVMSLHAFAWREKNAGALLGDRVIHHRNEDKLDARSKNLVALSQASHVRLHNASRRKHSRRKRNDLGGLYRPHQPRPVLEVPEEKRKNIKPPPPRQAPVTAETQLRELEALLASLWEGVRAGTAYLEISGRPIPPGATVGDWRHAKTRLLGLKMPRLGCTPAEACFVRLYASFGLELARLADDLGVDEQLLRKFLKRVSVAVAVDRWVRYGRLPKTTVFRAKAFMIPAPPPKRPLPTEREQNGQ